MASVPPRSSDRFYVCLDRLDGVLVEGQVGVCVLYVGLDFGQYFFLRFAFTDAVTTVDDAFYVLCHAQFGVGDTGGKATGPIDLVARAAAVSIRVLRGKEDAATVSRGRRVATGRRPRSRGRLGLS